tara:strand:- start:166 stop:474 length:309 start_codon:yes stop_codon:yes gene_type:complete
MLKIFVGTIIANLLMIIFVSFSLAGGFEEDPGPEELPVEQTESVIDEPAVEPEPAVESEPATEPEIVADAGITDSSGNIVIWSQGNVTYAGDAGDIYVRYGF